ncbi:MAG: methylenetetrahydrofolate reductase [Kiritimatiellae bacterium]|nr:methylenetetrahydrofolate reductase [Kiritimatiellia bacterium]
MTFFERLQSHQPTFSVEFFPPKTPSGWAKLYSTIADLSVLKPDLVSVTYGAGGSTRENTIDLVGSLENHFELHTMAHLTCLGHSQAQLTRILDALSEKRISAVMALRGDPPQGETSFRPHPYGFAHATDLIGFIKYEWPQFRIGCACYPEGHQESHRDGEEHLPDHDLVYLKMKQDLGADYAVSQLFFDNARYFSFVEKAHAVGISIPLIPGVMPLTSAKQIEKFTSLSGCSIPPDLLDAAHSQDPAKEGYAFALRQCRELLKGGAPGIHLFTLNASQASCDLIQELRGF